MDRPDEKAVGSLGGIQVLGGHVYMIERDHKLEYWHKSLQDEYPFVTFNCK